MVPLAVLALLALLVGAILLFVKLQHGGKGDVAVEAAPAPVRVGWLASGGIAHKWVLDIREWPIIASH